MAPQSALNRIACNCLAVAAFVVLSVILAGSAWSQEINVKNKSGASIPNFGMLTIAPNPVGGWLSVEVITIENTGIETLLLTSASLAATTNVKVGTAVFAASSVAAGSSTTLTITYTPNDTGPFEFQLSVVSNDADESKYDITVKGTATDHLEIDIFDDTAMPIYDGGTLTIAPNPTSGSTAVEVLTIENNGTTTMQLHGGIASGNANNVTNIFTTLGAPTLAGGASTTLAITYTPTVDGPFSFELDITSGDPDEPNYDILVQGTAGGPGPSAISDAATHAQRTGSQAINSAFAKSIASNVQNRFSHARGGQGRVFTNNMSQFSTGAPAYSSQVVSSTGDLSDAFGQVGERLGLYDGNGWTSFTTDDLLMAANSFSAFQSQAQVEQLDADYRAGLSPVDLDSLFSSLLPGNGLDFYGSYSGGHYYRKGTDAYKGFSSELAVGFDGFLTADLFAGVALASEASRIEFSGTTQGSMMKEGVRTDVYAAWEAFDAMSLEGLVSYGRFANKVTTLGETGKPNSERWIISGRANLDYNWDRFLITPNATISYTSETYDAYFTDFGTAVDTLRVERGSWSTGLRVQGFEPIIYGLTGYAIANADGNWETGSATTNSADNTVTAAWEIGLNGSLAGFADGTWLGDVLSTADTDIRYSQSGLFGQDHSSNWTVALRWNF